MENSRVICKTDAEILLKFEPLKDSGFAFEYVKKEKGSFQHYVNCNGRIFGPSNSSEEIKTGGIIYDKANRKIHFISL